MKELEKILEEMKKIKDGNRKEKLYAKYPPNSEDQKALNAYSQGYEDGTDNFYNAITDIIRKHLSRENGQEITSCSRDNDGWTPVEERLPEDDRYIFLSFENFLLPMIGRYEQDSDSSGNFYIGDETESCINQDMYVTAWHPLLEPYHPERSVH